MTNPRLFSKVVKPGRYLGSEYNSIEKEWQSAKLRCALIFPDLYEIGMSHQGLLILYHLLNRKDHVLAERAYCPDKDVEQLLRVRQETLTSLESGTALKDFDLLGFTLPYELCYTNILTVLDLAQVPLLASERGEESPIVLGGGACSMNPEPVANFFDAILLGDGEEAIMDIGDALIEGREKGVTRRELLRILATIDGVYVPALYQPTYNNDGTILRLDHHQDAPPTVERRVVADLDSTDHLLSPVVPNAKIVHDRLGVEIARGCTRGCRFCQAGITYRPVRERSPESIMDLARKGIDNSGFEELALLSLSTGDYSCIGEVLPRLMDEFAAEYVSVAMPSMRVGTLTPEIMDQIKRVRKTGFTLAPEAGSERLRRVINKGITEEDLLTSCSTAFSLGWKLIKLYFMIGLPTETRADIDEIIALVKKAGWEIDKVAKGKKQINVSVGTFVPKPHTPFQWSGQLTIAESRETINYLKQNLPRKGCNLKWHDPRQSYLEGVFSRGDRRLALLIRKAWERGARLDGWSDHFDLQRWLEAAGDCTLELDFYLRERGMDELLPWSHLHTGVDEGFLRQEMQNALTEVYTPDCRYHGCQQCGLCDFDLIQPIVHGDLEPGQSSPTQTASQSKEIDAPDHQDHHHKYLVHYSRQGNICYLGHLEILQVIFRALRRAGITTNFSKGYNPSPKVSFGPALPVGTRSLAEYFLMDLPTPLLDPEETGRQLSDKLPPGIKVTTIEPFTGKLPQAIQSSYTIEFEKPLASSQLEKITHFNNSESLVVSRVRKGKKRQFDIRPLIADISVPDDHTLAVDITARSGAPGIKPSDALQHILGLDEQSALEPLITKTSWKALPDE